MAQKQSTKKVYKCSKCSHDKYDEGRFHVAGGHWSKLFDIQGTKFSYLSCAKCGYTEIYKKTTNVGENVVDALIS